MELWVTMTHCIDFSDISTHRIEFSAIPTHRKEFEICTASFFPPFFLSYREALDSDYRKKKRMAGRHIAIEKWLEALNMTEYLHLFHQYGGVEVRQYSVCYFVSNNKSKDLCCVQYCVSGCRATWMLALCIYIYVYMYMCIYICCNRFINGYKFINLCILEKVRGAHYLHIETGSQ